jgi:acetyl esterase/lipase
MIFVHGGSWRSGNKTMYNFLGNRLARKHIVAINIDYPLSPAQYPEMALSTSKAVAWVYKNISTYGGDSTRIYISGHSAGGHLAALVSTDSTYFKQVGNNNPIKGVVLIDAAGLDMYGYLTKQVATGDREYLEVFTSNPQNWKNASALYHLHTGMPPFLIFRGGKTYPSIKASHDVFVPALLAYQPTLIYKVQKGKHHIGMITQFLNGFNPRYKDIVRFIENSTPKKN